jgi:hypothetical protein
MTFTDHALICKHRGRWICSWSYLLGFQPGVGSSTHKTLKLAKRKADSLDLPWKISKKVYVIR